MCVYVYIYIYIYAHINIRIHIYIYIHTHKDGDIPEFEEVPEAETRKEPGGRDKNDQEQLDRR